MEQIGIDFRTKLREKFEVVFRPRNWSAEVSENFHRQQVWCIDALKNVELKWTYRFLKHAEHQAEHQAEHVSRRMFELLMRTFQRAPANVCKPYIARNYSCC